MHPKEKVAVILTALALLLPVAAVSATASYSAPPYVPAAYGTQWTIAGVTQVTTVTIQDGHAGRAWQVYQVNNVGAVPLSRAISTVQILGVEIDGTWLHDPTSLAMVRVLNSNGVFTNTGAYVQTLGTIEVGSYSQHVLNIAYSSNIQEFTFSFNVWYLPS
ncbi:MAG: hypothetical protein JRN06_03400 [Nitrososphaerota archaeon]|nr:hypothetical protein [Nitrososphaerota archaeon]MDG7023095.1 hypothetical protein [Nitrososphaerota archaeon]